MERHMNRELANCFGLTAPILQLELQDIEIAAKSGGE